MKNINPNISFRETLKGFLSIFKNDEIDTENEFDNYLNNGNEEEQKIAKALLNSNKILNEEAINFEKSYGEATITDTPSKKTSRTSVARKSEVRGGTSITGIARPNETLNDNRTYHIMDER